MKDFQTLKILDKCKGVFRKLGVDYDIMRRILQVKLTMDQRRVPTILDQSSNKQKEGNQFLKSLAIYALMSIMIIPFIMGDQYFFQMSIAFGIIMFVVMTSLISDFSSVLLDVRDKVIIGTKPIPSKTVSVAKIVHISIYLFFITGALTALPIIIGLFLHGFIFVLTFILGLIFMSFLIIIFTALTYMFVLRFFDGEKLKDIINYVQILLSVVMIVGYQLVIRSFEFVDLQVTVQYHWWQFLVPPIWYGSVFELIMNQTLNQMLLILSILAFIVPVNAFLIYLKLVPSFERNLEKLLAGGARNRRKKYKMTEHASKIVCNTKEERTFFMLGARMITKERQFKLKVYPTLGLAIVFPIIFLLNDLRIHESFTELSASSSYMSIYFCLLLIPGAIHMLKFSEHHKGAWIYQVTPIREVSKIHTGVVKAFLIKLFVPLFIFLCVAYLSIFSLKIMLTLLIVLLVACLYSVICYSFLNGTRFPFASSFEAAQEGEVAKNFVLLIILGVFGGLHFFLTTTSYGEYVYVIALSIANWIAWKRAF